MKHPWEGRALPGRIWGNLYFCGTYAASTHLIDTGDGLILLDPGYPEQLYLVIDNIYRLGYTPDDIKIILLSHGHYDHFGSARALLELCGAKTYLSALDAPQADGTLDFSWTAERLAVYDGRFTPDVLLNDGDVVTLGNTAITCILTPGHTVGTMSFFFDAIDGERRLRCGMFGGAGLNTLESKYLTRHNLSTKCRHDYLASVDRMCEEDIDIFLGNHVWNNATLEKLEHLRKTGENRFIGTNDEWKAFLIGCREKVLAKFGDDLDAL